MLTQSKLIAPKNAPVSTQAKEQPKATKFDYQPATKLADSRPWPFLYGRKSIIQKLPIDKDAKVTILEIGCGTGKNLNFNLLAANKQIIGSSQMYASKSGMENGIESVKTNTVRADVVEMA